MAWEKRGNGSYYYVSKRVQGVPKKLYYGGGTVGRLAAAAEALRRAEAAVKEDAAASTGPLEVALELTLELNLKCELVAEAAMLAAGYHRASRHPWRVWRHGRRVLAAEPA